MKFLIWMLLGGFAATALADRVDEVRATEIAFAKAFAERDAAKFFSFVAEDAQFLGGKRIMRGKKEVMEVWSKFFQDKTPPFRWEPERVVTNAAGDLGYSTGPVFDEKGGQTGTYNSTWDRQADGSWKIVFDGGSSCPTPKE